MVLCLAPASLGVVLLCAASCRAMPPSPRCGARSLSVSMFLFKILLQREGSYWTSQHQGVCWFLAEEESTWAARGADGILRARTTHPICDWALRTGSGGWRFELRVSGLAAWLGFYACSELPDTALIQHTFESCCWKAALIKDPIRKDYYTGQLPCLEGAGAFSGNGQELSCCGSLSARAEGCMG